MSWRLWNRLFGWHYAYVTSQWGYNSVGRVHVTVDGRVYVEHHGSYIFLDTPGSYTVSPLTWDPSDQSLFGVIHQPALLPPPPRPSLK